VGVFKHFSNGNYEPPNPNPFRFEVIKTAVVGNYFVALVNYPDCTTFGGNKTIIYENLGRSRVPSRMRNGTLDHLDPHFLGNQHDPVARFPGSEEGWGNAVLFAKVATKEAEGAV